MAKSELETLDKQAARIAAVMNESSSKPGTRAVKAKCKSSSARKNQEKIKPGQVGSNIGGGQEIQPNAPEQSAEPNRQPKAGEHSGAFPVLWRFSMHPPAQHWTLSSSAREDLLELLRIHEIAPQRYSSRELCKSIRIALLNSMRQQLHTPIELLVETAKKYPEMVKDLDFVSLSAYYAANGNDQFMQIFRNYGGNESFLNKGSMALT